jgi:hypothetical protein
VATQYEPPRSEQPPSVSDPESSPGDLIRHINGILAPLHLEFISSEQKDTYLRLRRLNGFDDSLPDDKIVIALRDVVKSDPVALRALKNVTDLSFE